MVNTNRESGPVNTNLGPGLIITNWGPGLVNTNWGSGPVNTNWEPGPAGQGGGRRSGPRLGPKQRAGKYKDPYNTLVINYSSMLAIHSKNPFYMILSEQ